MYGESIRVTGSVQGVGFRPFVVRLANRLGLRGWVKNDGSGVVIRVCGERENVECFRGELVSDPPKLARVGTLTYHVCDDDEPPAATFSVLPSSAGSIDSLFVDDAALCGECRTELFDADNRRFRYPFINCTGCGPRLSIIESMPYDRRNTTMADFALCNACRNEYENPLDRRFHAQPNACPQCGPRVWLEKNGAPVTHEAADDVAFAATLIRRGAIIAVKSTGGFRLVCDATSDEALSRLRQRKHRPHKPFALMANSVAAVQRYAEVNEDERRALDDVANPIVLLQAKPSVTGPESLSGLVAPGQNRLGFMLPGNGLDWLLLQDVPFPVVMTSGNVSGDPQCTDNDNAREALCGIADYFLLNDRRIRHRVDDSVIQVTPHPQVLRRSRGMSTRGIAVARGAGTRASVLAMGAELKNTFCLLKGDQAFVSPHVGDLKSARTWLEYRELLDSLCELYRTRPMCIAIDGHDGYLSSRHGRSLASEWDVPLVTVQHHHAHAVAVAVEHGLSLDEPVLAIVLDGLGAGDNGALWGGEFLRVTDGRYERLGRFCPVPLPGGNRASVQPWRNLMAHLYTAGLLNECLDRYSDIPALAVLASDHALGVRECLEKGINSPPASSAGRLFDAVAAVLDVAPATLTYEGQAAIALQVLAERTTGEAVYPVSLKCGEPARGFLELAWHDLWASLLRDRSRGVARAEIAANFHQSLAQGLVDAATTLCDRHRIERVVLGGGVFQNSLLRTATRDRLIARGLSTYLPSNIPGNDGGIALGQAVIARSLTGV